MVSGQSEKLAECYTYWIADDKSSSPQMHRGQQQCALLRAEQGIVVLMKAQIAT